MDPSNAGEDPNIAKKCESNPSSPIRETKRVKTSEGQDHLNEVVNRDSDCLKPMADCNVIANACDDELKKNTTKVEKNQTVLNCGKDPNTISDSKKKGLLDIQAEFKEEEGSNCSSLGDFFSMGKCRKALYKMIIFEKMPFWIMKSKSFQRFSHSIQPGFILPTPKTAVMECKKLYEEEKERLKSMLLERRGRVCLAMEIWTTMDKMNVNYVVLTAQFIDDDWKLQKRILNVSLIPDPEEEILEHEEEYTIEGYTVDGETVGQMIETCLLDWGIEKVFSVTVDNGSCNDKALAYLVEKIRNWNGAVLNGDFMRVKSCVHIVNLMVRDALKALDGSIVRIRNAIEYVKCSAPSLLESFKSFARDNEIPFKNPLYLGVPARWDSIYTMLYRAEKFQKAFEKLEAEDKEFCHLILKDRDIRMNPPISEDWDNARAFLKLFKFFRDVTLRVTRTPCVTSERYFHEICLIKKKLEEYSRSDNSLLANTAKSMKVKNETLWDINEKTNLLLYVSIVLDPRYKLQFVLFTLSLLYGEERANEVVKKIEDMTRSLYNEYQSSDMEIETACTSMDQLLMEDAGEDEDEGYASVFTKHLIEQDTKNKIAELDKYLSQPCEIADETFDILDWWRKNSSRYKILAKMAKDVFAICLSTTSLEPTFSTKGRVLDKYHTILTRESPKMVEVVISLRNWLGSQDETDEREIEELEDEEEMDEDELEGEDMEDEQWGDEDMEDELWGDEDMEDEQWGDEDGNE